MSHAEAHFFLYHNSNDLSGQETVILTVSLSIVRLQLDVPIVSCVTRLVAQKVRTVPSQAYSQTAFAAAARATGDEMHYRCWDRFVFHRWFLASDTQLVHSFPPSPSPT